MPERKPAATARTLRLKRIVSGGQTGVDRAALDVALSLELPCGGWCPKGRKAEDGSLPQRYPLRETPSEAYAQRTEWNVRDADGTLILTRGAPTGGTAQTLACARQLNKPYLLVDMTSPPAPSTVQAWLTEHRIAIVNVAGPRESSCPGVYQHAFQFLRKVFSLARPS